MASNQDPAAQASDPNTELTTLQQLAQDHPELRPAIAANPSTYAGLLEWLGAIGDPEIDAALAAREESATPPPATTAAAGAASAPVHRSTSERMGSGGQQTPGDQPGREDYATPYAAAASSNAGHDIFTPSSATPDTPQDDEPAPRRGGSAAGIAALIAAAAVLVLGGWWIFTMGDDDDETAQTNGDPSTPEEVETEGEDDTGDGDGEGEESGPDLETALASLSDLEEDPTCEDPSSDASVLRDVAEAGAPDGTWGDPSHGEASVEALQAVRDDCGRDHAQDIVDELLGASDLNQALRTAIESDLSWLEAEPIPDDATEAADFFMPAGPMACVFDGSDVRCTVLNHNHGAQPGCSDEVLTIVMGEDSEPTTDCSVGANGNNTIAEGEVIRNGDLACRNEDDASVFCWSQESGDEFSLGVDVFNMN